MSYQNYSVVYCESGWKDWIGAWKEKLEQLDIDFNKDFVKIQNLEKLDKEYFKEYSGTEPDEQVFKTQLKFTIEELDTSEDGVLLSIEGDFGRFLFNYNPKQTILLQLVENQDNIDSDILVKLVELVVKKLNKFKSLIESIKGI